MYIFKSAQGQRFGQTRFAANIDYWRVALQNALACLQTLVAANL